jgi:hypothetical protein
VTVADWIRAQTPQPPDALVGRLLDVIGEAGKRSAGETADVCLEAATRHLRMLIDNGSYDRTSALDLLTVDALVTYAFEFAAGPASSVALDPLSRSAITRIGALTPAI